MTRLALDDSDESMEPFIHLPLRADRVEILLVALLALPDANEFGDIVCRIFRAPLDTFKYEALLYVWGSSEAPRMIQAM